MVLAALATACEPSGAEQTRPPGERTEPPPASFLDRYDLGEPVVRFDLPGRLDEVSGLAYAPDGRLFAHDDERGRVHEIRPAERAVGAQFDLGRDLARDDFEGIAVVGERFFLVTSRGRLYETREGDDRENMEYRVTDTGVGRTCEIEGLGYDPEFEELLIPCKQVRAERGEIVVHRLPIAADRGRAAPLRVPRAALATVGLPPSFAPSAIAVAPTGSWLLLSGRDHALVEVMRDGSVLAGVALDPDRHPQAEGLAIAPDGTIWISDERNGGDARITGYGRR